MLKRHRPWNDIKPPVGTLLEPDSILSRYGAIFFGFAEGAGTTVRDSSPAGKTGTLNATGGAAANFPQWVPGRFGGPALSFNGSATVGSFISLSASITTTATIWAWIYPTSTANNYQVLFGNSGTGLFFRGTRKIDWIGAAEHVSTGLLTLNTWNQVALALSGGNGSFYINSALDSTFTDAGATVSASIIGNQANEAFAGTIDHVGLLNGYTMSADQIRELYQNPFGSFIGPRTRRFATSSNTMVAGSNVTRVRAGGLGTSDAGGVMVVPGASLQF